MYIDDGIKLVLTGGNRMYSNTTAAIGASGVGDAPIPTAANNTAYRRPTTVSVDGGTFSQIRFTPVKWWYRRYHVGGSETGGNGTTFNTLPSTTIPSVYDCCHFEAHLSNVTITDPRPWVNESQAAAHVDSELGPTQVDAAVQLLGGARVCVTGDVKDDTGNIGESASADGTNQKTNAVIVLPDTVRFTLRTKGNFKANMIHSKDSVDTKNALYAAADFPKVNTTPRQENIWLWGSKNDDKQQFGQAMQVYPSITVPFHNKGVTPTQTKAPHTETTNALFGVHGDYQYTGLMAEIHTDTIGSYDKGGKGVIEVGPTTDGKSHFHIYGNGMIKNYEGCNGPGDNFSMHFGEKKGTVNHGGTPEFKINTKDTLYIVNFGNNYDPNDYTKPSPCSANLLFHTTSVDSIGKAFTGSGNGALQIQALNSVRFNSDGVTNGWDATSKGNNIYVLSDAGNISTQKLNIKSKNTGTEPGHGLINFFAFGNQAKRGACRPGTRNSGIGSIYFNDEVKIERTAATSTQTNIIAQNNIRTAKFTSTNLNVDTTNIISRKGDIWLGYSVNTSVYDGSDNLTTNNSTVNNNAFTYNGTGTTGELNIMSGWDDTQTTMATGRSSEGGNIYFAQLKPVLTPGNTHNTTVAIPYSSEYICDDQEVDKDESLYNRKNSYQAYEHSGIIGGIGACGIDPVYGQYAGELELGTDPSGLTLLSLDYKGNKGDLTVDAGRRGNIIMNTGTSLDYQNDNGNAIFRTRNGDIDMRDKTDAEKMQGGLLFLAQLENLGDLSKIGVCGCDEMRNNVYLQDFQYKAQGASGSVFIGADNNIKLNYGGLTNIGTRQDPFLSKAYEEKDGRVLKVGRGYNPNAADHCGTYFHCDLDSVENRARKLELFFNNASSGGFAAVASDMIDVYKDLIYKGGTGSGMGSVPGTGTLHGESVSGYGLFMKTQGNKKNWTNNVFRDIPKCPTDCAPTGCGGDGKEATGFLHNTVRMTFHGEAHFHAENQRVHLESPVIESFGAIEFDALSNGGSNGQITVKTDSLICHDSMIISGGNKVKFSSWSGLPNDQPIIKLGYSRKAAPFEEWAEENKRCRECVSHYKGKVYAKGETPLDTMFVKFGPTTELRRQNVMVIDHTVLSFLTDSFDHVMGGEVLNARYFVDTLKIRNQVEFWTDKMHERDGHLELISEQQMLSKDYAGMYTRHLHLEPIGACGRPGSELWLPGLALDVITYSTFGGFGTQYTDVHVENQANLNPGFTSLRLRGQCYEQRCGTLTMKDLRLDGGANLNFSVGTRKGLNGEYSDAIDVDKLTTYGSVNVNIEIRPCEFIEKRCYPIIYYKSVSPNSLNALKLNPSKVKIDGKEYPLNLNISTDGVVYVCVGDAQAPAISHTVTIPETAGVKTTPGKGIWPVGGRRTFSFSASYTGNKPLVVRTNRLIDGKQEVLEGVKMPNGEYEYVITRLQQDVTLTFGPDAVANELLKGTAVWSHGEMIYIRVDRADIASIYSVAGQLVKRVDLPEGDTSIPMSRGAYVITLKDGSVHKVIVK